MEKYQGSLGVAVTGGLEEVVTPWGGALDRYRQDEVQDGTPWVPHFGVSQMVWVQQHKGKCCLFRL